MKFLKSFYILTIIFVTQFVPAQDKVLAAANDEFDKKQFTDAEANYRIAGSRDPKNAKAIYNLGNTIYRINQPVEAAIAFAKAAVAAKIRPEKHSAFHNLGNTAMKAKDYTSAVGAYKQALINNPADDETRYNYALAKKMLKENPPKKDDNKKDKDKKDKDKKDKDKKDQDKKDQDKKDQDKKDGEDNKPEPKPAQPKETPGGISKQRLENLLEAVNNEEKKVQEKVNKSKEKVKPKKTDKDW